MQQVINSGLELCYGSRSLRFPSVTGSDMPANPVSEKGSLLCVAVYELLGEIVWNAVDTALDTFVTGCLPRLHKALDLMLFTLCACEIGRCQ